MRTHVVLKAVEDGDRRVGARRAARRDRARWAGSSSSPDAQGRGIGRALARAIEAAFPDATASSCSPGTTAAVAARLPHAGLRPLPHRAVGSRADARLPGEASRGEVPGHSGVESDKDGSHVGAGRSDSDASPRHRGGGQALKKILIADDNRQIRLLVNVALRSGGYEIIEAEDGEAALETAVAEQPDLILLDVTMPKLDGFEVLHFLQKRPETHGCHVIMLTTAAQQCGPRARARRRRRGYITKPFEPRLRETVERRWRRRSDRPVL